MSLLQKLKYQFINMKKKCWILTLAPTAGTTASFENHSENVCRQAIFHIDKHPMPMHYWCLTHTSFHIQISAQFHEQTHSHIFKLNRIHALDVCGCVCIRSHSLFFIALFIHILDDKRNITKLRFNISYPLHSAAISFCSWFRNEQKMLVAMVVVGGDTSSVGHFNEYSMICRFRLQANVWYLRCFGGRIAMHPIPFERTMSISWPANCMLIFVTMMMMFGRILFVS